METYFSTNLKALLMKKGLTQTDLSLKLGVKPQTVNRYIAGKMMPTIQSLILMGEIFDISLDDLVRKDLTDPDFTPKPSELYEKLDNVDKLTKALNDLTTQLKSQKQHGSEQNQ